MNIMIAREGTEEQDLMATVSRFCTFHDSHTEIK